MGSQLQLGSAWMLTVFIISFVTLGGAHTVPQDQDLHRGGAHTIPHSQDLHREGVHTIQQGQDLSRGGATKSQFENKRR